MDNNNSSALRAIFWAIFLMIFAIIVLCYFPIIKERVQVAVDATAISSSTTEKKRVNDPSLFTEYEIKDNEVTINKYGEGIVFTSSDNYTVQVLNDDMGYILTTVEQNGIPPKEHYFVGQGWYTMDASPIEIVEQSETVQVEPQTVEILEEPTTSDYQGVLNVISP